VTDAKISKNGGQTDKKKGKPVISAALVMIPVVTY